MPPLIAGISMYDPVLFCGWRTPNDDHKSLYLGFSQKKLPPCGPANGPLPQNINPQVSVFPESACEGFFVKKQPLY